MKAGDTKLGDVLLEIGTEEIPSRFLPPMLETLRKQAAGHFGRLRIPFREILVYATPRRLALMVHGVAGKQEDLVETYRGPAWNVAFDPTGNATRAAEGFAKSKKVDVDSLKEIDVDGVRYVAAEVREEGKPVLSILPELLPAIIEELVFPKNMYWSDPSLRFARPIRWIVALAGAEVIPFSCGDIQSGRISSGHRFMGNKEVKIPDVASYMDRLYDNNVILDQEKRRQKLLTGIAALEREHNGVVELDPELTEENLYLVEYPVPFVGSFDERFLRIPEEVLITSMKKNQKYFAVRNLEGRLTNFFVGVSNNRAADMRVIREGNERVLRARLEDAAFFWEEDLKHPLASCVERLKNVVYQEKLGSVYDKAMQTRQLALWLCEELQLPDLSKLLERAALLSKADLVTHMVYEFPELQGVMGREYARAAGEDPRVALALYEQYLPKSSSDDVPTDDVGAILGLAERIHVIVICHSVGFDPTGSQDPYGLRRAARCVNEIIRGRKLDVDVEAAVRNSALSAKVDEATVGRILAFMEQRLLVQIREKGYEHELARLAISVRGRRPLQVFRLMDALNSVKDAEWFASLVTSAVRVRNILQKAGDVSDEVSPNLAASEPEKALFAEVVRMEPLVASSLRKNDWKGMVAFLSELSPVITKFFDDVMVMDPDATIRANRLAILKRCNGLFEEVGNLGTLKLQTGDGKTQAG
ncbi:MAG: glycine--tRNA ligase subunit beta [Synergistaceae bacterium]|jgi:glycyl-tRNA synthetase beta chain|nr:glycine--tRNA ligase subunit beta [Synergistaceae bacterium]